MDKNSIALMQLVVAFVDAVFRNLEERGLIPVVTNAAEIKSDHL